MRVRREHERGSLQPIGVIGRNLRLISTQSTASVGKNEKLFGVIGLFVKHVSPILSAEDGLELLRDGETVDEGIEFVDRE